MKVVETEDKEKVVELSSSHPHINKPGENEEVRRFFLLKDGDEEIGCGYTRTFLGRVGHLGGVFVREDRRNQGAGKFLVERLEEELKDEGAKISIIGVHADNERGKEFWEENGYKVLIDGLGENVFNNETLSEILENISPKPFPKTEVTLMGKTLNEKAVRGYDKGLSKNRWGRTK